MPRKAIDIITGQKFGYLVAIRRTSSPGVKWLWRCTAPGCTSGEFERSARCVKRSVYKKCAITACKSCASSFVARRMIRRMRQQGPKRCAGCTKQFVPNNTTQKYHNFKCMARAWWIRTKKLKRPDLVECCNPEHEYSNPGTPKWFPPKPGRGYSPTRSTYCNDRCKLRVQGQKLKYDPVRRERIRQLQMDPDLLTKENILTSRLLEKYK